VQKLLFLGSSCIYPKNAQQPMKEEALLTGPLEATNEPYAIAKIAGIKLCESYNRQYGRDYRSVMPTNLYGPGDNFHPENSHVIPALLSRFHAAVQSGADVTIAQLARTVARVSGFKGKLAFDASKPDGTPRKLLDVSRLAALGWRSQIALEEGLRDAYQWFVANRGSAELRGRTG
jgi:GDP-L-fucose synthase